MASLVCGVAAGFSFGSATRPGALIGAIAYFVGNVLDCADGQLARLQGSASPVGYLVDGAADYVGTTSVFVGMAHWLNVRRPAPLNWWWLVVAAGISMAWQCAFLEEKRKEWQRRVYQHTRDRGAELEALVRQAAEWRRERTHFLGRFLIAGYRAYRTGWAPLTRSVAETAAPRAGNDARWAECHLPVLRRSVWIGPTMHVTAIVLCAGALNRPDWYLWAATTFGNLWMIATLFAERGAARCESA